MPDDLAEQLTAAAKERNMSLNDLMIALAEKEMAAPSVDLASATARVRTRQALQAALALLDDKEPLPVSA